jgi:GNAT superfamily N-acetyltransferase
VPDVSIRRAAKDDLDVAFQIVSEYYESVGVVARDSKQEFRLHYFGDRAGFWLASLNSDVIGCIALRKLPEIPRSGEVKRMYVQAAHRGLGIAQSLLEALEQFAVKVGYDSLYLDSAPGLDVAVRFYRRNGFEPCSRYNDNPQAIIYLRKSLRKKFD